MDRQSMMPWFDRDDMGRLMEWPQRLWSQMLRDVPNIEVADEGDTLLIRAEVPGVEPEDLDVEVSPQHVTVRGEVRRASSEGGQSGVYHSERHYGRFQRTIPLPQTVDPETAEARFHNGLLEVRLPRGRAGRRKLQIRSDSQQQKQQH